jgi:hypothetical protein
MPFTPRRGWAASHWTEEEEKKLAVAVVTCGEKNWNLVSIMMPNRSKAACRRKWNLSANGWTSKDDIPLCEAVEACAEGNWNEIAARMPGHSAIACLKRWAIIAESSRNRSTGEPSERLAWTDEQEKRLLEAISICGIGIGKWTVIGALVPGRSGLACREKWKRMTQAAIKTCDGGDSDQVSETCSARRHARTCDSDQFVETVPGPRQLMPTAITRDSTPETVSPGRPKVACSGQQSWPWTDVETTRLVDAVKIHGEWGKWDVIAAMVPNRSEAECRLKWTSATPAWTPQEDMLLAVAVKDCDDGAWLRVAARVPGRTRMDCFNRWTTLVEAIRFIKGRDDQKMKLERLMGPAPLVSPGTFL